MNHCYMFFTQVALVINERRKEMEFLHDGEVLGVIIFIAAFLITGIIAGLKGVYNERY